MRPVIEYQQVETGRLEAAWMETGEEFSKSTDLHSVFYGMLVGEEDFETLIEDVWRKPADFQMLDDLSMSSQVKIYIAMAQCEATVEK